MIRLDSADDYSIIKALMWLSVVFVSEFDPAESGERAGKRVSYPVSYTHLTLPTTSRV